MRRLSYSDYKTKIFSLTGSIILTNEMTFGFENGDVIFLDKVGEGRILIDVRQSRTKKLLLRIRTDGSMLAYRGGVSGCVVETSDGNLMLLHKPERVNDSARQPQIKDEVEFEGRLWSSFNIAGNLPSELLDYALTRPPKV